MKKELKRKNIQTELFEMSYYIEILISLILAIAIVILSLKLLLDIANIVVLGEETEALQYFLERAMTLAVGVEFIKMLCKHTPSTVIEILLFAIARQMVVEHMSAFDTLIGIIAIAILFATRKYLCIYSDEVKEIVEEEPIKEKEEK